MIFSLNNNLRLYVCKRIFYISMESTLFDIRFGISNVHRAVQQFISSAVIQNSKVWTFELDWKYKIYLDLLKKKTFNLLKFMNIFLFIKEFNCIGLTSEIYCLYFYELKKWNVFKFN